MGLYDASLQPEWVARLLQFIFELGATTEEVRRAIDVQSLGSLALDLAISPAVPGTPEQDRAAAPDPGRFWTELGLPNDPATPLRVSDDALRALDVFEGLTEIFGEDAALSMARVVGSSAARMAEALSWALRTRVEKPQRDSGMNYDEVVRDYCEAGRQLLPLFLDAVSAAFRRHLIVVSYQRWDSDPDRATVTLDLTVGFADMVGSTSVMQVSSAAEVASMVRSFEELVWRLVTDAGGRVVKLIGDEAMFVIKDPQSAVEVARALHEASATPIRVGLACGEVMAIFGDFYGQTVNLAARLVRLNERAGVVVSDAVRQRCEGLDFVSMGQAILKGFDEPVDIHRLTNSLSSGTS
jgi:class 3 adenylate cyclase